jgi:hypothetical protein
MVGLAWPLVSLVGFVFFAIFFRRELRSWLPRVTHVGPEGVTASPAGQSGATPPALSAAQELLKILDNQILLNRENQLRSLLVAQHIEKPDERETVLVRFLAAAWLVNDLDWVYFRILGSQMGALLFLNAQTSSFFDAIKIWYDQAAKQDKEAYAHFSFDQWLAFFYHADLIERTGDRVQITPLGKEFLSYVMRRGLTTAKSH